MSRLLLLAAFCAILLTASDGRISAQNPSDGPARPDVKVTPPAPQPPPAQQAPAGASPPVIAQMTGRIVIGKTPYGYLALESTPRATIVIDGRSTRLRTPQKKIRLSPGLHTITLRVNSKREETFMIGILPNELRREQRDLRVDPRVEPSR